MNRPIEVLTQHVTQMLRQYRAGHADTREIARPLAEAMVEARQEYRTSDGAIDWAGRSAEYREWLHDAFLAAGITSVEERNRIQSAARYHVTEYRAKAMGLEDLTPERKARAEHADFVASAAERKRQLREQEQSRAELLSGSRPPKNAAEARAAIITASDLVERLTEYLESDNARAFGLTAPAIEHTIRLSETVPRLAAKVAEVVEAAAERRRSREEENIALLRRLSK